MARTLGSWAVRLENRLLPLLFALFALGNVKQLTQLQLALTCGQPLRWSLVSDLIVLSLLLLFNGWLALATSRRGRLQVAPETLDEIVLPIVATYGGVIFLGLFPHLPAWSRARILPTEWLAGAVLIPVGLCLCLWAARTLGPSFAVLAEVREIRLSGPYRFVRHPIYAGYLLVDLGFFCLHPSLAYAALGLGFTLLNVWRTYVEERKLKAASPAYVHYCQTTPRLLPRSL